MSSSWVPMESNPEVLNKFLHEAGVPCKWALKDIHGLDLNDVTKAMPDQTKVKAFLFLFPKSILAEDLGDENTKNLFFIKENFPNASGPIALIHIIANVDEIELQAGSVLQKFLEEAKSMSPDERGKALAENEEFKDIQSAVDPKAKPGDAEFHYVAIVRCEDVLYEFDGTKLGPKAHGPTKADTFVQDAAEACKKFIQANPGEHRFSVLAFAAAEA